MQSTDVIVILFWEYHEEGRWNPSQHVLEFSISEGRESGVGSVVVEFGVFGAPRISVQRSQNTCFKGFWDLWTENRGAPKMPNSTTTDPTPHSRPSDYNVYMDAEALDHNSNCCLVPRNLQRNPHKQAVGTVGGGEGGGPAGSNTSQRQQQADLGATCEMIHRTQHVHTKAIKFWKSFTPATAPALSSTLKMLSTLMKEINVFLLD